MCELVCGGSGGGGGLGGGQAGQGKRRCWCELKKSIKTSMMTDSMKSQPHTAYGF